MVFMSVACVVCVKCSCVQNTG